VAELKPGDFVLMQFGHNDGGAINDESRARGSLRGTGDETEEIDNLLSRKHEVVHTFGWYMKRFIGDAKAKGATPIVLSLIPRNIWKDGKVIRGSDNYGKWAAEIAAAEQVPFIDLNEIVAKKYEALGPDQVKKLYFLEDHTHTTPAGAEVNAASVIEGLRALKKCPLTAFLVTKSPSPAGVDESDKTIRPGQWRMAKPDDLLSLAWRRTECLSNAHLLFSC
jgi:lysophospholipase L1-like esterase